MRYSIVHTVTGECDHWAADGATRTLCGKPIAPDGAGYGACETCDRAMRSRVTVADTAPEWFRGVSSVWSAYGHRFMSTGKCDDDAGNIEVSACITCGAEYKLIPDAANPGHGEYCAADGSVPMACSGRSDLAHGIERNCDADNGRECADMIDNGTCQHTDFMCDCLLCA